MRVHDRQNEGERWVHVYPAQGDVDYMAIMRFPRCEEKKALPNLPHFIPKGNVSLWN